MVNNNSRQERFDAAALSLLRGSQNPELPWYDSGWLRTFLAVRSLLRSNYPDRVSDFEAMIAPLRTDPGFRARHIASFIDSDVLNTLRTEVTQIIEAPVSTYERNLFGRDLLHNRALFSDLAVELTPTVSALVGEPVEPYYNFLSLYGANGVCTPHMDAPEAKWTLDICLNQSDRWPLYVSDVQPWPENWQPPEPDAWQDHVRSTNAFAALTMDPSDAAIFAGSSQWHYRDAFPAASGDNGFCHLLFLHYIPAGCGEIVDPEQWAALLGIPAVAPLAKLYRSEYHSG